jgi:hypothetical protein
MLIFDCFLVLIMNGFDVRLESIIASFFGENNEQMDTN